MAPLQRSRAAAGAAGVEALPRPTEPRGEAAVGRVECEERGPDRPVADRRAEDDCDSESDEPEAEEAPDWEDEEDGGDPSAGSRRGGMCPVRSMPVWMTFL